MKALDETGRKVNWRKEGIGITFYSVVNTAQNDWTEGRFVYGKLPPANLSSLQG